MNLIFRLGNPKDHKSLWEIIRPIIRKGGTYVFSPDSLEQEMMEYWMSTDKSTYVAEMDGKIVGTFYLKPNQPGLGNHICNAGFMVDEKESGKGIGRQMGLFALAEAKKAGYLAMQYNYVISTNQAAVKLWQSLGFDIIGEIPEAYRHPEKGLVGVYVMCKKL
ncbi:GNAT family N-acetyltransferase [Aquiflexum gelatinilyticum]|uniref:GNAT family N-acetyltransferase n=1 Tax=Aquiflexum gelatinilyticum TaxID=2961943 RepID=A0A9X2P9I7_9BACT|nr:GNAT family N-acetyltransferase [Aquiflexum gelatinilyticum]MCR9016798.1 GNAT family N-acetyltransferase [Aquiflexum gelatinilyticum]